MKVKRYSQEKSNTEYREWCRNIKRRLDDYGVDLEGEVFTLVTVRTVKGTEQTKDSIQKLWQKQSTIMPLAMCLKSRPKEHYLNVNARVAALSGRFTLNEPTICLNEQLFGIIGTARHLDAEKNVVKFDIDKEAEELKLQNPFFGLTFLKKEIESKEKPGQSIHGRYFKDNEVEAQLNLQPGSVHKITSSFMFKYNLNGEDTLVDLGLNLKNFYKNCQVADYVRYVIEDAKPLSEEAKQNNQMFKTWQYSEACIQIIREYN